MTTAVGSVVEAVDYNTLVGSTNKLNDVWWIGNNNKGYGQSNTANVAIGDTITAAQWNVAITKSTSAASHQGSSITGVSAVVAGGVISASGASNLAPLASNMTTIYSNRLNAVSQGTTAATGYTNSAGTWTDKIVFVQTVTFASGDAARYFFNAGGQLALSFSHPAGGVINTFINALCTACGSVVLSSPITGTVSIAGTSWNGVQKVGGSGSPTVNTNNGYYAWTATKSTAMTQAAGGGLTGYNSTFLQVEVNSNGTNVGGNGDAGSVITLTTTIDEVWSSGTGLPVSTGTVVTVTVRPPEVSYIGNSWGTPSVSNISITRT